MKKIYFSFYYKMKKVVIGIISGIFIGYATNEYHWNKIVKDFEKRRQEAILEEDF